MIRFCAPQNRIRSFSIRSSSGRFLHDPHLPDDLAKPRLHVADDDRPVPIGCRITGKFIEQRITKKMMGVKHEDRLAVAASVMITHFMPTHRPAAGTDRWASASNFGSTHR